MFVTEMDLDEWEKVVLTKATLVTEFCVILSQTWQQSSYFLLLEEDPQMNS